jgi:vWA domain found in the FtsH ternary systems/N-terminal helical region fused to the FtsH ternary system vWA domain
MSSADKRPIVIRDSAEARQLLTQGLWWQRIRAPKADAVRDVLGWAKEVVSSGKPLPPLGFLADLGHITLTEDWESRANRDQVIAPNLPVNLVRTYEDHVLGKMYADWTFGRACDALRRYARGREQGRGLSYLLEAFRERSRFDGIELSVGVLNTLLEVQPEELLGEGFESLRLEGPHPLLPELYESLIQAARRTPEVLGPEDLFDLESRAALEDLGQRLAHRQVLRAAAGMAATLPKHKLKPLARRMEVPTRILDEDMYPVGGFTSLSNRGSIESLLHSQLAYMEPAGSESPDLFDSMFLMDELLYYARDENQFLRRRRTFVLALSPDLVETRFKDSELPYQRGVMLFGLLHVLVKKLVEWLSTDALTFQILFLGEGDNDPLANERAILTKLFYEEIALDVVRVERMAPAKLARRCEDWARRSMVHVLMVGIRPELLEAKDTVVNRLAVPSPRPELGDGHGELRVVEGDDASDCWARALQQLLMRWI